MASMLGNLIGGFVKDLETLAVDTLQVIKDIPKDISEGYHNGGLLTKQEEEKTVSEEKVAPKEEPAQ
jgi:hypothetical protein